MKDDILIVGAGVSGLMTAIELAQVGVKSRLFDTGHVGMESSWAGGGILSPIYPWLYPDAVNDLAQWSTRHYPEYFTRLYDETSIDPQWLTSGHLILQTDLNIPVITQWAAKFTIQVQQLDQQQLHEIDPALNPDFNQGLWLPDVGQVRNPRLIQALKAYAEKTGSIINEHTEITRILHNAGRVTGIETKTERITADRVLITAGAWSSSFNLGDAQPDIQPIKGQMIQLQADPDTIRRITLHDGRYVIPRKDGKILAGSTLEHTGFDKATNEQTRQELQEAAISIYPTLKNAPIINHWSGLRPGNERQSPYIGEHPEINGLFFNTGHYRNGIVLGLASARLAADLITGNPPILSPAPYSL